MLFYCTALFCSVVYLGALYSTVLYCSIFYSTVLYYNGITSPDLFTRHFLSSPLSPPRPAEPRADWWREALAV